MTTFKKGPMTKKLLLKLPEDVHTSLKQYQIDRSSHDRKTTNLNTLLVELVKSGTARVPLNETATGILKRAVLKSEAKSVESN
jgi:hypothetical protein